MIYLQIMAEVTFNEIIDHLWVCLDNKQSVEEVMKTFSQDCTNADRFSLAYLNLQLFIELPYDDVNDNLKSRDKSNELRNLGNKFYSKLKPDLANAFIQYTRSIAYAPYPMGIVHENNQPIELAKAFANRSAVLFAMNKYEACLRDIKYAFEFQYPESLAPKLLERMSKCNLFINEKNTSIVDELDKFKVLPLETKNDIERNTGPKLGSIPTLSYRRHKTIPSTSNSLSLKCDEEMGRYMIAEKNINPGDILIVEKPYSSVLLPDMFLTHCSKCLMRHDALIPCKHCSLVMYCSEDCRQSSWQQSHHIECPILTSLLKLDMGEDWSLALRVILIALNENNGLEGLHKIVENLDKTNKNALNSIGSFNKVYSGYTAMHHLIQNTEFRTYKNVYKLATIAACIVSHLEKDTDMFNATNILGFDSKIFVGSLLLKYLQSLSCNCYSVAELNLDTMGKGLLKTEVFGCAVYNICSLVNHSCDPNVVRSFHNGDTMTVTAIRPIKRGKQVFCDYGYSYNQFALEERQKLMENQYYFRCKCDACLEDWPDYSVLNVCDQFFICAKCRTTLLHEQADQETSHIIFCHSCNYKMNLSILQKQLQEVVNDSAKIKVQLLLGCRQDFVNELASLLKVLDGIVEHPCKAIVDVQDTLRHNMMQLGNLHLVM